MFAFPTKLYLFQSFISRSSYTLLKFKCLSSSLSSSLEVIEPEWNKRADVGKCDLNIPSGLTVPEQKPSEEVLYKYLKRKPNHTPVFNLAHYVNKNSTLQELVKLGVNLHKIEITKGAPEVILRLDFERDIKKYIVFLHDVGVAAEDLGLFFTKNPFIFKEDLDNLQVRINYLESKAFTPANISRIITKNPRWLLHQTQAIDDKLGYFQNKFKLKGNEVRHVAVRMPKIITFNLQHIEGTYFSVKEEMGFDVEEIKALLLQKPKLYTLERTQIVERFDYLHNEMGLKHNQLISQPGILLCRRSKLHERHQFLKHLGRDQYDPTKPGYISPLSVVSGTDAQFCSNVAGTATETYNRFLKTLC